MTGWLNSPTFISNLTIQSFQDLGYNVVAIPESSSFLLLSLPASAAFAALGYSHFLRRNMKSGLVDEPVES